MIKNKRLIVDKVFLDVNHISKELFNFENIKYYEELKPVEGNSIHNSKYVRIVFNKYLNDGITRIAYDRMSIPIQWIKNYATLQENIVAPRN